MASINGNYFNFTNSLFSSSSTGSTSGNTSGTSLVSDYISIKNGSYKKLLNAYYAKQKAEETGSSTSGKTESATTKAWTTVKSDSSALASAAAALTSKSSTLFEKVDVTTTDKDGNKTTAKDYDREAIVKAVKAFADAYNDTLDSAAAQDNTLILRKTAIMTKSTSANKNLLSKVGVTIGKDNKLTVDEEKLKSADINELKSLFSGNGSYASSVAKRASDLNTISDQLIKSATNANASIYTNSGNYSSLKTENLFNSLL